jgi:hypothetical protein
MRTVDSKARRADEANKMPAGPPSVGVNDEYRSPVDLSSGDVDRWENEGGAPRMQSSGDVGPSIRLGQLRTQLLSTFGGSDV